MKEFRAFIKFTDLNEKRDAKDARAFVNIDFEILVKGETFKKYSLDVDRRFDYIPFKKGNLLNFKKEFLVDDDIDLSDVEVVVNYAELVFPDVTYKTSDGTLEYWKTKFFDKNKKEV